MLQQQAARPLDGYLTVTAAARVLGVSPQTLRNWDRAGKLRPFRHPVNGYRLYRPEDLQALLAEVTSSDGDGEGTP